MSTRKTTAIVVLMIVALSCFPWIRQQLLFSVLVGMAAIALVGLLAFGGVRRIATLRRSAQLSPVRFRTAILRRLAIFVAVFVPLVLTVPHFVMTSTDAYKLVVSTARQNPRFTEALGGAPREGWFSEGKWEWDNEPTAEMSIPVRGRLMRGTLSAAAVKVDGKWKLTKLMLDCEQRNQQIDLLSK